MVGDATAELQLQIAELTATLQYQQSAIRKLEHKSTVLQDNIKNMRKDNAGMKLKLQNQEVLISKLEDETFAMMQTQADARHDEDFLPVAFYVASHSGTFGPFGDDTTVEFEVVYNNVEGGWNSAANVFQALHAGYYHFTASMRSAGDAYAYCNIVHTPASTQQAVTVASLRGVSSTYGNDGDANSVIIQLETGDTVHVELEGNGGSLWSTDTQIYSTFSGFLIFHWQNSLSFKECKLLTSRWSEACIVQMTWL